MRISDWSSDVCSSDLAVEELRLERQPVARPQRARGAVAEVAVLVIADAGQGRRQGVAGLPVRPCGQRPGKPGDGVFVERAFGGHGLRARRCKRFQRAARSEEHTSELQSLMRISYAVFCLKKKKMIKQQ